MFAVEFYGDGVRRLQAGARPRGSIRRRWWLMYRLACATCLFFCLAPAFFLRTPLGSRFRGNDGICAVPRSHIRRSRASESSLVRTTARAFAGTDGVWASVARCAVLGAGSLKARTEITTMIVGWLLG